MPSPQNSAIYQRLRDELNKRRIELDLKQEAVGKRMGLTQSTMSKIERGHRSVNLDEFVELAKIYKIDPVELFRKVIR